MGPQNTNDSNSMCSQPNSSNSNKGENEEDSYSNSLEEDGRQKPSIRSGYHLRFRNLSPRKQCQENDSGKKRDFRSPSRSSNIKALQEKLKSPNRLRFTSPVRRNFNSPSRNPERSNRLPISGALKDEEELSTYPRRPQSPTAPEVRFENKAHYIPPTRNQVRPSVRPIIKNHKDLIKHPVYNSVNTIAWVHRNGDESNSNQDIIYEEDNSKFSVENKVLSETFIEPVLEPNNDCPSLEEKQVCDNSTSVNKSSEEVNDSICKSANPELHSYPTSILHQSHPKETSWFRRSKEEERMMPVLKVESFNCDHAENTSKGTCEEENRLKEVPRNINRVENTSGYNLSLENIGVGDLSNLPLNRQQSLSASEKEDDNVLVTFQDTPPPVFTYYKGNNKVLEDKLKSFFYVCI